MPGAGDDIQALGFPGRFIKPGGFPGVLHEIVRSVYDQKRTRTELGRIDGQIGLARKVASELGRRE